MRGKGSVLVVGGGPAGLTASLKLRAAGFRVTLVDEGPAVNRHLPGFISGALPPVVLGADRATMALLGQLGTARRVQFPRGLHYEFYAPGQRIARLRRPLVPVSLRTIISLGVFPALSLRDRRRILTFLERTWERDPPLDPDLENRPADIWLEQIGQSEQARRFVWEPLARFLLGDDLSLSSARLFVSAMTRCFLTDVQSARLALPSEGLAHLLLEPAIEHLRREDVVIRRSTAVKLMRFGAHRVTEVQMEDGHSLRADWYVLALPHHRLTALLPERMLARYAYFQQIGRLHDVPAMTVHLWLADRLMAPRLLLLADHLFHWLTCRRLVDDEGRTVALVSLVATGTRIPRDHANPVLVRSAVDLVVQAFALKTNPKMVCFEVVRSPRAYLSVRPGTSALRPLQQSPVPNLLVAGAWTDTGLPSTTESAIRSGNLCAEAIVARSREFAS